MGHVGAGAHLRRSEYVSDLPLHFREKGHFRGFRGGRVVQPPPSCAFLRGGTRFRRSGHVFAISAHCVPLTCAFSGEVSPPIPPRVYRYAGDRGDTHGTVGRRGMDHIQSFSFRCGPSLPFHPGGRATTAPLRGMGARGVRHRGGRDGERSSTSTSTSDVHLDVHLDDGTPGTRPLGPLAPRPHPDEDGLGEPAGVPGSPRPGRGLLGDLRTSTTTAPAIRRLGCPNLGLRTTRRATSTPTSTTPASTPVTVECRVRGSHHLEVGTPAHVLTPIPEALLDVAGPDPGPPCDRTG